MSGFDEALNFVSGRDVNTDGGAQSPSGLWHVDVTEGEGNCPNVSDNVKVHYTGWLPDGTKFDSSVDRGEPATWK